MIDDHIKHFEIIVTISLYLHSIYHIHIIRIIILKILLDVRV